MAELELGLDPRGQHYAFAHLVMRQLFFREPAETLAALTDPGAIDWVEGLWGAAARGMPPEHRVGFDGASIAPARLRSGTPIAVVVLPPPRRMCEAYMVGMSAPLSPDDPPSPPRYFTLELGVDITTEQPRTVLCEWRADGSHRNWGDGPAPAVAAFVDAASAR